MKEWDIKGYFYDTSRDYSLREDTLYDEKFSVINMGFIVVRNTPKLVIVLLIPVFCLVILSNCALLIPIENGEKFGYAVTLLLALFIYKETSENMIPAWKRYKDTPRIVVCFTGITIGMTKLRDTLPYVVGPQDKKMGEYKKCLKKVLKNNSVKNFSVKKYTP